MKKIEDSIKQRNQALEERLKSLSDMPGISAIELLADSPQERAEDLALVRDALSAGIEVRRLGPIFSSVVADLSYMIDWAESFRFWPLLDQQLNFPQFQLSTDHNARHEIAEALDSFADEIAKNNLRPQGGFARQFPLMSRALLHAIIPRCAHRRMARLLKRATERGIINAQGEWPTEQLLLLSASLGDPLFFTGILEHPALSARIGPAILSPEPPIVGTWLARLKDDLFKDEVSAELLSAAREQLRSPKKTRNTTSELPAPPAEFILLVEQTIPTLCLEVGPFEAHTKLVDGLEQCARSGAQVSIQINDLRFVGGYLFNALRSSLALPLTLKNSAPQLSLLVDDGSPSQEVESYFSRFGAKLQTPLFFKEETPGRYTQTTSAIEGDTLYMVLELGSTAIARLIQIGFIESGLRGASSYTCLRGGVSSQANNVLSDLGLAISPKAIDCWPVLSPPIKRNRNKLTYPAGQDAWLLVKEKASALSATIGKPPGALLLQSYDESTTLVHIPAELIKNAKLTLSDGKSRSEFILESQREQTRDIDRWRVSLQPPNATIEQLLAGHCWLEVDSFPGVAIVVELRPEGGTASCLRFDDEASRDPFVVAYRLRASASLWNEGNGSIFGPDGVPEKVQIIAWSEDEPGAVRQVALLRKQPQSELFEWTPRLRLRLEEAVEDTSFERLDFSRGQAAFIGVSPPTSSDEGIYIARSGQFIAAVCCSSEGRRVPRLPEISRAHRGNKEALLLLDRLRAIEVASISPKTSLATGLLLRRSAARRLERALIASLCGAGWLSLEDEAAQLPRESSAIAEKLAPLLWLPKRRLIEMVEESESSNLLDELLELAGQSKEPQNARHLLLLFCLRPMAAPSRDAECICWAWANTQRARIVRFCALLQQPNEQLEDLST